LLQPQCTSTYLALFPHTKSSSLLNSGAAESAIVPGRDKDMVVTLVTVIRQVHDSTPPTGPLATYPTSSTPSSPSWTRHFNVFARTGRRRRCRYLRWVPSRGRLPHRRLLLHRRIRAPAHNRRSTVERRREPAAADVVVSSEFGRDSQRKTFIEFYYLSFAMYCYSNWLEGFQYSRGHDTGVMG